VTWNLLLLSICLVHHYRCVSEIGYCAEVLMLGGSMYGVVSIPASLLGSVVEVRKSLTSLYFAPRTLGLGRKIGRRKMPQSRSTPPGYRSTVRERPSRPHVRTAFA
jgi:hypothetical protein